MKSAAQLLKSSLASISLLTLVCLPLSETRAGDAATAFAIGQKAFYEGDFVTARSQFLLVLESNPDHYKTKILLTQCEMKLSADTGRELRNKVATITIPRVDFDEADLEAVLESLASQAAEVTKDEFRPSFILKGEKIGERTVTLKASRMPLSEILRYIADQAKVNLTFEKFAIVATPISTGADGGVHFEKSEEVTQQ